MQIRLLSEDGRSIAARRWLEGREEIKSLSGNMIILPIPSTKDKRTVFSLGVPLLSVVSELKAGDVAVGYGIPEETRLACYLRGAYAIDIADDEEYQREGAYLTALGCVNHILTEYSVPPSELSFGIVGYGRIGKALSGLLLGLPTRVTVYSSRAISGGGFTALPYSALAEADRSGIDVLINTAPARLIRREFVEKFPEIRLIELASGDNFPEDLSVTRLMQLPSRVFPEGAGRAVGRAVMRALVSSKFDGAIK